MIDIVLVNWNSGDFLHNCLASVFSEANSGFINRVYIIDNNSSDTSADKIVSGEKIHLVKNTENLGFAKACNQGFRLCTAPFVLLLNPDTQLFAATLKDCLNFMEKRSDVDILGCQLVDEKGEISKSCARFPTPLRMCYEAVGLSKISPKIFTPASLMTDWDHRESRFVSQVMGAFMFMRIEILQKAAYFDERFFVYYEELDFSERVAQLGGRSFYNVDIKAMHSGGGTTSSVKAFRLFLNLKSRLQYAKKHFKSSGYKIVYISTFLIEPFSRALFSVIKGKFGEIKDIFKGYKLLLASLPIKK